MSNVNEVVEGVTEVTKEVAKSSGVKNLLKDKFARVGLLAKKHSPEILVGVGVVGVVTSTVLACKATLKVQEVLEEKKNTIENIELAHKEVDDETYSLEDYNKDLLLVNVQSTAKIAKMYAPAAIVGVASIGCFLGAHKIMSKRNVALVGAYKMLEKTFDDYRDRVKEEIGEVKEEELRYKMTEKTVEVKETDKDGNEKIVKKKIKTADGVSQYGIFFDGSSVNWSKNPEYNRVFLLAQQNYANDMLNTRGHVFLNEVYDLLGMQRTQAGSLVGWVAGHGDDFIDFGIEDHRNIAFVNGYENIPLLDFNVDGAIYDLI